MEHITNTIFGGLGFIGSHLHRNLEEAGLPCPIVSKGDSLPSGNLGNVYYCAGVTSDFRSRPFDTIDAHVSSLANVLKNCEYTSFLYLSSARIYRHSSITTEDAKFTIDPHDPENLVDISKLAGESLCLSVDNEKVRIVRLSNVFGNDFFSKNFLTDLMESAVVKGEINLRSSLDSCKDYVDIENAVDVMQQIAKEGKHRIYNIASGKNTSHKEITHLLKEKTGCNLIVEVNAETTEWPSINIDRISQEFNFKPTCLLEGLGKLVDNFKENYSR